ncbi:serine dehydratase subunit alpha family protein, partial [Clostridium saudiense]|nr:serine dehydratase subunit alpha family protein [Clostridium saudiense]
AYNIRISEEGLKGTYGIGIGKVILESFPGDSVVTKLKAYAAAASEARMTGSSLPVMTNSGSGNQGMTTSIPVIIYAKEKGLTDEQLYRGLVFSNLMTIHQKTGIGRLSAFCGAVSAGCASGAAITYLEGGSLEQINKTVINTLANISGIVCDGAKASCAAKIATSIDAAMMAHYLAMSDQAYRANTGILKEDIEDTITAVGRLGKEGMKETDKKILDIMLED